MKNGIISVILSFSMFFISEKSFGFVTYEGICQIDGNKSHLLSNYSYDNCQVIQIQDRLRWDGVKYGKEWGYPSNSGGYMAGNETNSYEWVGSNTKRIEPTQNQYNALIRRQPIVSNDIQYGQVLYIGHLNESHCTEGTHLEPVRYANINAFERVRVMR